MVVEKDIEGLMALRVTVYEQEYRDIALNQNFEDALFRNFREALTTPDQSENTFQEATSSEEFRLLFDLKARSLSDRLNNQKRAGA
jgi:hypothetical protein